MEKQRRNEKNKQNVTSSVDAVLGAIHTEHKQCNYLKKSKVLTCVFFKVIVT